MSFQEAKRRLHYVKSVRTGSYSGPYTVRMRENADQNNSEYGHFLHSVNRLLFMGDFKYIVATRKNWTL